MVATEKFLFDFDFDLSKEEDGDEVLLEVEDTKDLKPEIIVPTFSEKDLENAREDGFAKGKEIGVKETLESIVQKTATALETIIERIDDAFSGQEKENAMIAKDAVNVSNTIVRKIFPQLSINGALDEVERIVISVMGKMIDEPRLTITINNILLDRISSRLKPMMEKTGFEGKVVLNGDDSLSESDCRIEWDTGTASRDTKALWGAIDTIIDENMPYDGSNDTPPANPQDKLATSKETEDPKSPQLENDKTKVEHQMQSDHDSDQKKDNLSENNEKLNVPNIEK